MTALEEYNRSRVTRDYTLADRMRDELLRERDTARAEVKALLLDWQKRQDEYETTIARYAKWHGAAALERDSYEAELRDARAEIARLRGK